MAVFGVAVLAAIGAGLWFWKSKPEDTPVRENAFRLTLPGKWSPEASSDPTRWTYHSENGHEQLTVSLFAWAKRLSPEEQRQTLERMTEIHRNVQIKMPGMDAITMTDTTFGESGGTIAARYGGVDPAHQRRFWSLLLSSPVAVTVFYYEAVGMSETEADMKAKAIMNSIVVPRDWEKQ